MEKKNKYTDQELLDFLQKDTDHGIELIFRQYYSFICKVIVRVVRDENLAEDLAQDVFFELWRKRESFNIKTSLPAYLRRASVNKTLNYIRDKKIMLKEEADTTALESQEISVAQQMETAELEQMIHRAIDNLPERRRIIFSLSRFEDLSYQDIATNLGISIKTVEHQISAALKTLRVQLAKYSGLKLLVGVLSFLFF